MNNPPPAKVLPLDAVGRLQRAAQTPLIPEAPEPDLWRRREIEKATQIVKYLYPQFFRQEIPHETETQ